MGSIFRTADAAGVERLHLCGLTCWPPHKKLEKTSLGAHEHVAWTRHETGLAAVRSLKAEGFAVVAIETVVGAPTLGEFAWPSPVALVFGHEVVGIMEDVLAECDAVVRIPMAGAKSSLNVATAFGVVVYHLMNGLLKVQSSIDFPGQVE